MKQLGIKSEEIDAEEVIIKTNRKKIVIKNPKVTKVNMHGSVNFQVSGTVEENPIVKDEDIELVVQQTGCSKEDARKVLEETNDIAKAILKIKGN